MRLGSRKGSFTKRTETRDVDPAVQGMQLLINSSIWGLWGAGPHILSEASIGRKRRTLAVQCQRAIDCRCGDLFM